MNKLANQLRWIISLLPTSDAHYFHQGYFIEPVKPMPKQQEWNQLIRLLETTADEMKQLASSDVSIEQAVATFGKSFYDLLDSLKQIEAQQDKQHKLDVYTNVANFFKDSLIKEGSTNDSVGLKTSLDVVLLACGEQGRLASFPQPYRDKLEPLTHSFKQSVISVRVHYHFGGQGSFCHRLTDIFFVRGNSDKAVHNQVKEEIVWDSLPAEIRSALLNDGKEKVSFQLYP